MNEIEQYEQQLAISDLKQKLSGAESGERMWKAECMRLAERLRKLSGLPEGLGYEKSLSVIAERLSSTEVTHA